MVHHLRPVAAILVAALLVASSAGYPWALCGETSNFMANSTYQAHLDFVTATLPKNVSSSPDLFANITVGTIPEQLWAMGLCRGDVNATDCFSCLTQAFQDLPGYCSYNKEATIYYNPCMVHYSDVHTLPSDDTGPRLNMYQAFNDANVKSDPARFERLLAALMNATAEHAANSVRRFATGEADFDQEFPKIYSVAQCTPDQTAAQCRKCIAGILTSYLGTFGSNIGGRVLGVDCTYRFETAPFYNGQAMVRLASSSPRAATPSATPAVGTPPATGGGGRKHRVPWLVLAVVLPTLAALNLAAFLYLRKQRQSIAHTNKQQHPMYSTEAGDIEMVDSMMIDVSTLRAATGDFDESNKLGKGDLSAVYKGILPDGEEIVVKRLSNNSTQGVEELKNELALVAKLKHKNLVRLVGVCLDQQERLLVYEFVPNRSLDLILFHTENEESEQLDWGQRWRIINGIARGLQYLHEDSQLKVVHRDLKASNILLDENMNPKISDFGLARIFGQDQTQAVTSRVFRTNGYMAPEYLMRGNYSVKSDAFSFGVMVLEIVTGRENNSDDDRAQQYRSLLTTVWEHWEAGTVAELVDPRMGGSFPEDDVIRCIHIGLLCVQRDPAARPLMSSVVMMLSSNTITLQSPSKPGLFVTNTEGSTLSLSG